MNISKRIERILRDSGCFVGSHPEDREEIIKKIINELERPSPQQQPDESRIIICQACGEQAEEYAKIGHERAEDLIIESLHSKYFVLTKTELSYLDDVTSTDIVALKLRVLNRDATNLILRMQMYIMPTPQTEGLIKDIQSYIDKMHGR